MRRIDETCISLLSQIAVVGISSEEKAGEFSFTFTRAKQKEPPFGLLFDSFVENLRIKRLYS